MIRWLINTLKPSVGIIGLIIILVLAVLALAWIGGCIAYWLLSIAFPEYISFDWHHWRFVALGFLHGVISGIFSSGKKE